MAKADRNSSSDYYPSSNTYPDPSEHQNNHNTPERNEVSGTGVSQQSKEKEKSNDHTTTRGGVKIPKLQTKLVTQDRDNLPQFSLSRVSNSGQYSTGTGAPGPKPEILIGMPGSPSSKATSPRQQQDTSDKPLSPRHQQTQSLDTSLPASPRKMFGQGPVPQSSRSLRYEKNDSTQKNTGSLSPRDVASPSVRVTDTHDTVLATTVTNSKAPVKSAEASQLINPDDLLTLLEQDLTTNPQSNKPKTDPSADDVTKIVRVRARVSSRMLGEAPPVSPRSAQWARGKPTTADRMMASTGASATSRSSAISTTAQLYSKATLDLLKQGNPESIKSIARIDPHIAAADMPKTLRPFYVSGSQASFPIAPLLRQLYKTDLEGTQQWKNAEHLTKDAIKRCDRSIQFGETAGPRKDHEIAKLKPLAETVINTLFPAETNSTTTEARQSVRRLSQSFLTNDFVNNILFAVDQSVIERCQADDSLKIGDINATRYAIFFDLILTRMTLPMLIKLFPEIPNQSQIWMQSALRESLKNAMPSIATDFFEQSLKAMPEKHRSFINQKAKQEEVFLRKAQEDFREKRIAEIKAKSNSSRQMNYYNAIADQKKRRDYTKNNKALYDKVLGDLNTESLDDAVADLIGREITKKLKNYDQLQTIDQIKQDLLSIFNSLPKDKVGNELRTISQGLNEQVGEETNTRVRRRTVAFNVDLVPQWFAELGDNISNFGDQTIIHQAVIETFNYEEPMANSSMTTTTTTTNSPTTTTTTTTTTTNTTTTTTTPTRTTTTAPSVALSQAMKAGTDGQVPDLTTVSSFFDDVNEEFDT